MTATEWLEKLIEEDPREEKFVRQLRQDGMSDEDIKYLIEST